MQATLEKQQRIKELNLLPLIIIVIFSKAKPRPKSNVLLGNKKAVLHSELNSN